MHKVLRHEELSRTYTLVNKCKSGRDPRKSPSSKTFQQMLSLGYGYCLVVVVDGLCFFYACMRGTCFQHAWISPPPLGATQRQIEFVEWHVIVISGFQNESDVDDVDVVAGNPIWAFKKEAKNLFTHHHHATTYGTSRKKKSRLPEKLKKRALENGWWSFAAISQGCNPLDYERDKVA